MQLLTAPYPTYCDVDDTLVAWNPSQVDLALKGIDFTYTDALGHVKTDRIVPNRRMIEQLKLHALRGHTIFVWSAGGEEWAYAACMALGLYGVVRYVMPKPLWIYDDKQPADFMPKAFLLEDK